jgi:hypothetical protein
MLDYGDMQFKHKEDCHSRDSKNIEKRTIRYEECIGEVEYDVYCKECGEWLYSFSYGFYDMY